VPKSRLSRLLPLVVALGAGALLVGASLAISEHNPDSPAVYVLIPGAVVGLALGGDRTHEISFFWIGVAVNLVFYSLLVALGIWLWSLRADGQRG